MNTEQDREDLIAEARYWPRDGVNEGRLVNALADAVEALVKERDELAAVVDGVRNLLAEASRFREADIDTWVNALALKNVLYAREVREGEA